MPMVLEDFVVGQGMRTAARTGTVTLAMSKEGAA